MKKQESNRLHTLFFLFFIFAWVIEPKAQDTVPSFPPIVDTAPSYHKDSIQYFDLVKEPPVIRQRRIPDTIVRKIKSEDAYWYADKAPARDKQDMGNDKKRSNSFLRSKWFYSFFWIMVSISFIGILIWYLASGNINLFRKQPVKVKEMNNTEEESDFDILDYPAGIQKAINDKNYRLAIRFLYLQMLKDLSENGLITQAGGYTNSDYLSQLKDTPYYKSFFNLTRNFEYSWYGKFNITENAFQTVYNEFNNLKQQIQ